MSIAVIAFGGNLNHPREHIFQAAQIIARLPETVSFQLSSLYRTTPVGYANQPDFINAVAILETNFSATKLLNMLQNLEIQFGRERLFSNAPRTLDLDMIDFNHEIWQTENLILPHPRAHQRSFVMRPLAEIAPDYPIGKFGTAKELAEKLGDDGIEIFQAA